MSVQIGNWAKRQGQKWHLVDSTAAGMVVFNNEDDGSTHDETVP